jgi:hypothetical protein
MNSQEAMTPQELLAEMDCFHDPNDRARILEGMREHVAKRNQALEEWTSWFEQALLLSEVVTFSHEVDAKTFGVVWLLTYQWAHSAGPVDTTEINDQLTTVFRNGALNRGLTADRTDPILSPYLVRLAKAGRERVEMLANMRYWEHLDDGIASL